MISSAYLPFGPVSRYVTVATQKFLEPWINKKYTSALFPRAFYLNVNVVNMITKNI